MNRGYVKLYRKSLDNDLIRNPVAWQFMCWCLLKATHKAHRQLVGTIPVALEPGQFIFGRASAAKELQSTERKVRTCLELLQEMEFLTIRATNKFSVITIVNWDVYQEEDSCGDQQNAPDEKPFCQQNDQQNSYGDNCLQEDTASKTTSRRPADFEKNDQQNDQQNSYGDKDKPDNSDQQNDQQILPKATTNKNIRVKSKRCLKTSLCPVFSEDSVPYRLAVFMHDTLKANLPTLKEPNLQKWASDFDVAIRNDPRMKDTRYVAQVIKWACSDSFWKANIQSPGKLREKFDQLAAKMESVKNSRASPATRIGPSRNGNAYADGRERDYGQSDFGALGGST